MFGRDPVLPLNSLLEPKVRYMGNDINVLSLEALKTMYEIAATNLKMAREKKDSPKDYKPIHLQPGDMVLVQNHTKGPFDPKYVGDYHVIAIKGNQVEVRPSIRGPTEATEGLSIIWTGPSQVRTDSIQEAVGKLTACTPIGTNWPYTLVQLHEGTFHTPLPNEWHLGVLPQRRAEAVHCWQISQLEVCQLLVTSPQVIYPVGLNGQDEPIITSLPELLASHISLTTGKHI